MAGTITHEWDGTILTITSDSGTSSMDLKGGSGDTGPRGPQGPAGVIYDADGQLVLDLSMYATLEELNEAVKDVTPDLAAYATKVFVSTEIAKAQLEGAGVDTSGFATLDDLAAIKVNIDGKTIIEGEDGTIRTTIGGFANNGGGVDYSASGLNYQSCGPWNSYDRSPIGNIGKKWAPNCLYKITMTFKDGKTIGFEAMFERDSSGNLNMVEEYATKFVRASKDHNLDMFYVAPNRYGQGTWVEGDFAYGITKDEGNDGIPEDKIILTAITISANDYVPIDAHYIPVDGTTIYMNTEGKLACSVELDEGGTINMTNYYTKAEVDALIQDAIISTSPDYPLVEEVAY